MYDENTRQPKLQQSDDREEREQKIRQTTGLLSRESEAARAPF